MKLLLLGATGLVGGEVLNLALANSEISEVIAPTRKPLPPHPKLTNPVTPEILHSGPEVMAEKPDAVICTLGTTQAIAGSQEAFRHVDYDLPLEFARQAKAAGVPTFAIVTALGASATTKNFYYRTKGEVERDIQKIGLKSLIICRPSLIDGKRAEKRNLERVLLGTLRALAPILPKKFRVNPADVIAASLLRAVVTAGPGVHAINAENMI